MLLAARVSTLLREMGARLRTGEDEHRREAAVLAKEDVGVEAVADHANLVTLELKGVRDIGEHELGGLAHDDRLFLRRACTSFTG